MKRNPEFAAILGMAVAGMFLGACGDGSPSPGKATALPKRANVVAPAGIGNGDFETGSAEGDDGEIRWGPWSPPVNLGPVVNSKFNDRHPAISPSGLSLYITSDRPGGFGLRGPARRIDSATRSA